MRGCTAILILACLLAGVSGLQASANECSPEAADKARSALNRYLGENPDKHNAASEVFAVVTQEMGGDIQPWQTCEAVARMMTMLKAARKG